MADIKETIPFSYDEIYSDLVERLIARGYDAPFEGSNLAQIISILSYVTSSLNFNTAVNINENLLSLARKRKNIIQDARMLSYEPSYSVSYQYQVSFKTTRLGTFTIPRFTELTINGKDFVYVGEDKVIQSTELGQIFTLNVKQGIAVQAKETPELNYSFNPDFDYIDVPYDDVENDGLRVSVTYYDDNGNFINEKLLSKNSFTVLDKNNDYSYKYFRKDDIQTSNCRIYFRMCGLGTKFPKGTIIKVDIIRTEGSNGNPGQITNISWNKDFGKFIIEGDNAPKLLQAGNDGESDKSIKENAPLYFNTASRVVTAYDYSSVAKSHPAVEDAKVWGGEDEVPVTLGNLYYSFTPEREKDTYNIFTNMGKDNDDNIIFRKDGEWNSGIDSDRYYYKLENPYDSNLRFLRENEFYSTDVIDGNLYNEGVIDLLDKYKLPALKSNIRNPIYVYCDLYINIKKYPYGTPSYKIRQTIFEEVKKYFDNISKFESQYYNSNLIRKLDNILGLNNGIEIYPKFYILIKPDNLAKVVEKDENFSKMNVFFKESYIDETLNVIFYLANNSTLKDRINLKFNKLIDNKNEYNFEITQEDLDNGYKLLSFRNNNVLNSISAKYISYDGLQIIEGKDTNLYNFTNKTIYFTGTFNKESTELLIYLPRYARQDDKIIIFGLYSENRVPMKLKEITLKQSDIINGFVSYIDTFRGQFAGVVGPEEYKIEFNSLKVNKIINGTFASSEVDAKEFTKNQDDIFNNMDLNELFYNYFQDKKKINVKFWIPQYAKVNDIINLYINDSKKEIILNDKMIKYRTFDVDFEIEDLKIKAYNYLGFDKSIKIYPILFKTKNMIKDIEDDSLAIQDKTLTNYIEYQPSTTYDRIPNFKDNVQIQFLTKYQNKYDVRNLFVNIDDSAIIKIKTPDNGKILYQYPYIYCNNIINQSHFNVNVEMEMNNQTYFRNIDIFVKNASADIYEKEGHGGYYIYLDFPVENIYQSNKLNVSKLPKFYFKSYDETNEIKVDLTIDNNTRKSIFPFEITEEQLKTLDYTTLEYIQFPIIENDLNSEGKVIDSVVIGTYTIYNDRKPYIRIKLKKSFLDTDYTLFELEYPSANINFIRNSFLKLRNVYFDQVDELVERKILNLID